MTQKIFSAEIDMTSGSCLQFKKSILCSTVADFKIVKVKYVNVFLIIPFCIPVLSPFSCHGCNHDHPSNSKVKKKLQEKSQESKKEMG